MPLARIISHSHACSRELALELLARGYAVEIVSPDRLPDNIADLELRVDEGPGDHLFANVKVRDSQRLASLDFVHHLKAPMMDFVRRPIQPPEGISERSSFHAERITAAIGTVTEPVKLAKTVPPAAQAPRNAGSVVEIIEAAHSRPLPELPPDNSQSDPVKPPSRSVIASAVVQPASAVLPRVQLARHNSGTTWRAALTLGCIILLAFSLWFGIHHRSSLAENAARAAAIKTVADGPTKTLNTPATAGTLNSTGRVNPSKQSGDYIAPNTIVYLDKRIADESEGRAKLANRLNRSHPAAIGVGGGVVAANSVTYLSGKPTPQAPKLDSGIKPATAPN